MGNASRSNWKKTNPYSYSHQYGPVVELIIVNVICNVAFGFCDSVKTAMIIRFFSGLLDGTIPVCKTIQTEVSTPETIGFVSSLFFVGSAIGG